MPRIQGEGNYLETLRNPGGKGLKVNLDNARSRHAERRTGAALRLRAASFLLPAWGLYSREDRARGGAGWWTVRGAVESLYPRAPPASYRSLS